MINKSILTATAVAGVALAATAVLPAGGVDPSEYMSMRPRQAQVMPAQKAPAKGLQRVLAFRDGGNAEVEKYGKLTLMAEEDFSLLTTGSEEAPDLETDLNLPDDDPRRTNAWYTMDPKYTHGDLRWGVGNGFSAGGMLYFPVNEVNSQGQVVLPLGDFTECGGTFVVEFKIKLEKEFDQTVNYPPVLVEAAETNNMGPLWDDVDETFACNAAELSTEWRTFRVIFQGGGKSTLSHVVVQGINNGFFIDDVKLYALEQYVRTPELKHYTNFTEDSFNVNWSAVQNATEYTVNLWREYLSDDGFSTETEYLAQDKKVTAPTTTLKIEGANPEATYYWTVTASDGTHTSLTPLKGEVFGVAAPKMRQGGMLDGTGNDYTFEGGVEPVKGASGYTYVALAKKTAEEDGPFTITNEEFTGWRCPIAEPGVTFTRENPNTEGVMGGPYFPTDIKQQGWYGKNFNMYSDYVALAPFFYTASRNANEQTCWVSPEFDLSHDEGKISVDLSVCADPWTYTGEDGKDYSVFASLAVALFNYNEETGEYDIQADCVYVTDVKYDWADKHVDLKGGTAKSRIGFFGLNSYEDIYVDNIVIKQNYKKGDEFLDPFYYCTWQLGADAKLADPDMDNTTFRYEVPAHASGMDVYDRAFAARIKTNDEGNYIGEALSDYSDYSYVGKTEWRSGVTLVNDSALKYVRVVDGTIMVTNPEKEEVSVTAADGKNVRLGSGEELSYTPGAKGVYVVSVGKATVKIAL